MTNHSASVFLIDDSVRAIGVVFENSIDYEGGIHSYLDDVEEDDDNLPHYKRKPKKKTYQSKVYTYKSMDNDLKVGDYVVVETDDGTNAALKVARVVDVDADVHYNSAVEYKWIVDKVDLSKYRELIAQELVMVDKLKVIEKKAQRAKMKEQVLAFAGDELDKVKFLAHDTSLREGSHDTALAGSDGRDTAM